MATLIPDNRACFTLREAATAVGAQAPKSEGDRDLCGVVTDSRRVGAGQLYVALVGETHDGHDFIPQLAGSVGAVLVRTGTDLPEGLLGIEVPDTTYALGELARYHRKRWGGQIVAITGSAGKTTTKELAAAALRTGSRRVAKTAGNLNNLIGVPMTLLGLEPDVDMAVVEAGTSVPGEIPRLAEIIDPDVALVVGVSVAHTQGLGTLEDVADEKMALLRPLGADEVAIYSADHPSLCQRAAALSARRLSFGRAAGADVQLLSQRVDADLRSTCSYRIAGRDEVLELHLGLLGIGPALDTAAVLACVIACDGLAGIDPVRGALEAVSAVAGRLASVASLKLQETDAEIRS